MAYRKFVSEEGERYGSFETFRVKAEEVVSAEAAERAEGFNVSGPGWFWWPCLLGYLPDGEPHGPFDTEAEAVADAAGGPECLACGERQEDMLKVSEGGALVCMSCGHAEPWKGSAS